MPLPDWPDDTEVQRLADEAEAGYDLSPPPHPGLTRDHEMTVVAEVCERLHAMADKYGSEGRQEFAAAFTVAADYVYLEYDLATWTNA